MDRSFVLNMASEIRLLVFEKLGPIDLALLNQVPYLMTLEVWGRYLALN